MRSALPCVVAALVFVGCADAALHAASGRPRAGEPRSVEDVELVFRSAGSLTLCARMNAEHDPGAFRPFSEPFASYSLVIPEPGRGAELSIGYEDWQRGCPEPPDGARFLFADVIQPQGVPAEDVRLGDQKLVLIEASEHFATLDLNGSEARANPLFWPLVPVAYGADAVAVGAGAVMYGAAFVAAVASFAAVGAVVVAVSGPVWVGHKALGIEPGGATPPDPAPPPGAPPDPPSDGASP